MLSKDVNIVTVVQARMSSSRLPFKVMMSLAGKPLIARMVERVMASELAGTVVVAATTDPVDDPIEKVCIDENIEFFRGDPLDLLDRHYQAAKKYDADIVLKIPSDCPLIDPNIITKVIKYYLDNDEYFDFVSNLHPPSYPDGNDVEVMSIKALEKAWKEAEKNYEREHTTPYIWENHHLFRIGNVLWDAGKDFSQSHRWTIDYEEDYLFIKTIYDELYSGDSVFSMYDILNLLDNNPAIKKINQKYAGEYWYRHHMDDLKTVSGDYKAAGER